MSGEAIEDLRIDSIRLNDLELAKKFDYKPNEATLKSWLNPQTLKIVTRDASVA